MLDFPVQIRTMKALSLWQPWASLMARGVKRHETRHWPTPYRGMVAIHAAKTMDLVGAPHDLCRAALDMQWPMNRPPVGVIVAVGELTACLTTDDVEPFITRADREAGNFGSGRFAWAFSEVRALRRPIPMVGRQGLFNWTPPEDLEDNLGPRLDHAAECRGIGWL